MSRFQTSFHKESSGKLDELFESLTLDGKKDEFRKVVGFDADSNFKKELRSVPGFEILKPVADLGYFVWKPNVSLNYEKFSRVTSVKEILDQIQIHREPPSAIDLAILRRQLPKNFAFVPEQSHRNKYPYKMPYIVPLHVASQHRGLDLDLIDFFFGGSALGMLADQETPPDCRFIGFVVPQTKIVLLAKEKDFVKNYAEVGFQFERWMTGRKFTDRHDVSSAEHMHIIEVGEKYNVFFCAEVDALGTKRSSLEITTGNPRYFSSKAFQMISNGSTTLCAGSKYRGSLTEVRMISLSTLLQDVSEGQSKSLLKSNIMNALDHLKNETKKFKPGEVFEIHFRYGNLRLEKINDIDALLPVSVAKELLPSKA